jgi:hypothetical protein
VVLAGRVTGSDTDPAEQSMVLGRFVSAGLELSTHDAASVTFAERVTLPPADGSEAGETLKPAMVGAGSPPTVVVVVAFTVLEPVTESLKV